MKSRKEKALTKMNSNVFTNYETRESFHGRWNRGFALVDKDGDIREVKATERGAKSRLKELKNNTYISDFTGEITDCGSHLDIIKIESDEILESDSPQLWYNTLQRVARELGGRSFNIERFKYYMDIIGVDEEIEKMVEENYKDIEKGVIFYNEEYENGENGWEKIKEKIY